MTPEIKLIHALADRSTYLKYRYFLNGEKLDTNLQHLVKGLDKWFQTNEEGNVPFDDLYLICLPDMEKETLTHIINNLKNIETSVTAIETLQAFKKQRLYEDMATAAYEAAQGSQTALNRLEQLQLELSNLKAGIDNESPFFEFNIEDILQATDRSGGLKWRLRVLREHLGNLLPGEFGFFVARPETGKTTMLASECTYMASQLDEDSGPVIWFNNEEPGHKILLKLRMAALGKTEKEIRETPGHFEEQYVKYTNNKIKLVDEAVIYKTLVEQVCDEYKPSLIILDQIDPIKGFKADRDDLRLGEMYKWARMLAKKHEMPVIAVCQASATAENKQWLQMDDVANAKTEKQAAADWIVGIGKLSDPTFDRVRYLSYMKNKLNGRHGRYDVLIKPEIGRYEDV